MNIVTFNMLYGTSDEQGPPWQERRLSMEENLKKLSPDILGAQECMWFQIHDLNEMLKDHSHVTFLKMKETSLKKGLMEPIFYNKEKFECLNSALYPLSADKYNAVTYAELQNKANLEKIHVFNTHIASSRDEEVRVGQCQKLIEILLAKNIQEEAIFVMGDFNSPAYSKPYQLFIEELEYLDAWRCVNQDGESDGTTHGFTGEKSGRRIDHIFTNSFFDIKEAFIDQSSYLGTYPSDHFPLKIVI